MSIIKTADLPIGFGLGKDQNHWGQVYRERFEAAIAESSTSNHQPKQSTPSSGTVGQDSDIMSINEVSVLLRCSIDRVRRISRAELPARNGPGRSLLYLKTEVIEYIKQLPPAGRRASGLSSSKPSDPTHPNVRPIRFDLDSARQSLSASHE